MGNLSNLYISKSFQSLIHLGSDNVATSTITLLQDGYGNSIGVGVNTSGDLYLSGSLTSSLQQGYAWVGDNNNKTTLVATSSFGGGSNVDTSSLVTTASFNSYTQSTNIRLNNLETTSASVNISISNLNSTTASQGISITNLNASSASQQVSINALNVFTASQSTASLVTSINELNSWSASAKISITNINSATQSLQAQLTTIGGQSGSWGSGGGSGSINTGSFATTGSNSFNGDQNITGSLRVGTQLIIGTIGQAPTIQSLDSGTPAGNTSLQVNAGASGSFSLRTLYGAGFGNAILEAYDTFPSYTSGGKIQARSAGGVQIFGYGGGIELTGSALQMQGFTYPTNDGTNGQVLTTNGSKVLSFTTVSGGGSSYINPTLNPYSGSLILVANTFTSSSFAHISASANGQVNLVFKNSNNTADTILSGSNNIFTNPTAAAAGFKRYIGGSGNVILSAANAPSISGSMGYSPAFNSNYLGGPMNMRGPVSSSIWTLQNNITIGSTTNFGQTAANHAQGIISGLTFNTNILNSGLNVIANKGNISAPSITNNNFAGGTTVLNLSSASIALQNNIGGGYTVNNNMSASQAIIPSAYYLNASSNIFIGSTNSITTAGGYDTGDTANNSFMREYTYNQLFGYGNNVNLSLVPTGSNALSATMIAGFNLIITGSNPNTANNDSFTPSGGSAFIGRYNAVDGNKAQSAQTILAVGTGNATTRKTGFLIDSGSNIYAEGTFNVSGSTTLSGSLYIQSASAFPTQIGTSLVTWNSTTGQLGQATIATLISSSFSVGAFNSTVTQSGSAAVSQSMTFNNTDISNGVSIVSNSQITLANTGTYNIQFSAQLLAPTGADTIWIWLKKNGTNVSNTGTKLVLKNNEASVAAWNFVVPATASDYFELVWQSLDGHATLLTEAAAGNYPAIPSVIVTVTQVE